SVLFHIILIAGFRFIAEKVSHRPPILACHASSSKWVFTQSQMPTQKFYGKSYEVIPNATVQILFLETGEKYIYEKPVSYLRNVTMGEKYVEPVGHMVVKNSKTSERAVVSFKAGGMFSGRSEDIDVQAFSADGQRHSISLSGKWTTELTTNLGDVIWRCGQLVSSPETHCGFTIFAAQLNQITSLEKNHLAKTDSRLRPDQRMLEEGNYDGAEIKKERVENLQRARRAEMDSCGEIWTAKWFDESDGAWKVKCLDGYWEMRERGFPELPILW
ncbi:Oxysterol-binding isoform A, partial [Neolecta irregularis DAH-3]